MKNVVVEALNKEHGAKIVQLFTNLGFCNPQGLKGLYHREDGNDRRFYGLVDGVINHLTCDELCNVTVLTLEKAISTLTKQSLTLPSMKVSKTEDVEVNGQKRKITVVVLVHGGAVKTGYAVCLPEDKFDEKLADTIATGRALKDKTNLTPDMVMGIGMDKKYILYAIAEHTFKVIGDGKAIKGIKAQKK